MILKWVDLKLQNTSRPKFQVEFAELDIKVSFKTWRQKQALNQQKKHQQWQQIQNLYLKQSEKEIKRQIDVKAQDLIKSMNIAFQRRNHCCTSDIDETMLKCPNTLFPQINLLILTAQ